MEQLSFLGATLGMVASTRPERWAQALGPGRLEANGRLLIGSYENYVKIFGYRPFAWALWPLGPTFGYGPLAWALGTLGPEK